MQFPNEMRKYKIKIKRKTLLTLSYEWCEWCFDIINKIFDFDPFHLLHFELKRFAEISFDNLDLDDLVLFNVLCSMNSINKEWIEIEQQQQQTQRKYIWMEYVIPHNKSQRKYIFLQNNEYFRVPSTDSQPQLYYLFYFFSIHWQIKCVAVFWIYSCYLNQISIVFNISIKPDWCR